MVKPNREDCNVPTAGWSGWKRAIVPGDEDFDEEHYTEDEEHYTERNGTHKGYYCDNIKTVFNTKNCGIYEWKAVHEEGEDYEVYVGSTCRSRGGRDAGALERRIMEYCRDGSHKKDEINRALGMGYELHVRVKETGCSKKDAEDAENEMLDSYNYAWNVRRNAPYRGNIPPPV